MTKHYLTWIFLLIGMANASAQIAISAARTQGVGPTPVTVTGTVMNGNELGQIRYLQDATGGIAAYFQLGQLSGNPINIGDSITVTGILKNYYGLLEFDPISTFNVISHHNRPHDTVVVTAANAASAYVEANEGKIVKITGLTSIQTTGGNPVTLFAGNTNYNLDGNAALQMRITNTSTGDTGMVGKPAPTGGFDIIGLMSQHCTGPITCTQGGYQLLPRLISDLVVGPAPNINSRITVIDITQTTLHLSFTSQNPGDTRLVYGTTPALGIQVSDATQVTDHSMTLQNLTPGTVYYVQAKSNNPNGNSDSPVYAFVTESQSTGKIKTFFTHSLNAAAALPGNPAVYTNDGIADTIASYINRAQATIDVAIYNFGVSGGHGNILSALNNAANRGVQIRLIAEGANANTSFNSLNASVHKFLSPEAASSATGIMHNKFVIIDAESADPNQVWLWTGSTNWTDDQLEIDYNNGILFQDQSLARTYKVEFEEMWGSNTTTPGTLYNPTTGTGTARFGPYKTDNTPHELKIGGNRVESYFSPSDQVNNMIIKTVNTTNTSLQIAANTFTRSDVAYAIRDKVNTLAAGNCARALMDDTSSPEEKTVFNIMRPAFGQNLKTYTRPGIYHHKYMVVDQDDAASDPLVLTGSHNWSTAADTKNDENTVIVHNQLIANQYYQEFAARFVEMGGAVCTFVENKPTLGTEFNVYPNPASENLRIQGASLKNIRLTDATGRTFTPQVTLSGSESVLSVKGLSSGIYLLQGQDGTNWKSIKVSIVR